MTDPCYTKSATLECSSFTRSDGGGWALAGRVGHLCALFPGTSANSTAASLPPSAQSTFAQCTIAAEWAADLDLLCGANPFLTGCSLWEQCQVWSGG